MFDLIQTKVSQPYHKRICFIVGSILMSFSLVGCLQSELSDPTSEVRLPTPFEATEATRLANKQFGEALPLSHQTDHENARRGFVASIEDGLIKTKDGRVVWDSSRYRFLQEEAPASVNPSLWRQAQLNSNHGLFKVSDRIYQVRGYDLAVMTIIEGDTGRILVDPLLSREAGNAALDLVNRELGGRDVKAVLITHSHPDHFGGIRGVVSDQDVTDGRTMIVAPIGFTKESATENLLAGPAMSRRVQLQFGNRLPANKVGGVDSGIGKGLSVGEIGFMQPTDTISETGEKRTIDGVEFVFINASGTEAPAEFMFYLPQFRALHMAEVTTGTMHNVLTLRGAQVRDVLSWSKLIDDTLIEYGEKSDVVLASHNWPTWGTDNVRRYLQNQRDTYRYIHDQTMRLANLGYNMDEVADQIGEPKFMQQDFATRGYYGTMNHNSKATYQRYYGWWDGNPANLNPHPPEAQAQRYVDLLGGASKMIAAADRAFADGDYRWVSTIMNHLVFAESDNTTARAFLAAAYEQLGFQSESSIWRNYYLTAALELRDGVVRKGAVRFTDPAFVNAVPTEDNLDALAVRVNPKKAVEDFAINLIFSDSKNEFSIRIRDGVAVPREGYQLKDASVTVTLTRNDFITITRDYSLFEKKLSDGSITVDGDAEHFSRFLKVHDVFDPFFNIVTP